MGGGSEIGWSTLSSCKALWYAVGSLEALVNGWQHIKMSTHEQRENRQSNLLSRAMVRSVVSKIQVLDS
jgi:hypothetical protein